MYITGEAAPDLLAAAAAHPPLPKPLVPLLTEPSRAYDISDSVVELRRTTKSSNEFRTACRDVDARDEGLSTFESMTEGERDVGLLFLPPELLVDGVREPATLTGRGRVKLLDLDAPTSRSDLSSSSDPTSPTAL
jgi:hypothetical protein